MSDSQRIATIKPPQLDYILLDGSGSMSGPKWHDTCAAIDAFVAGLKAENISSHIYLHVFSDRSDLDLVAFDGAIAEWQPIAGRLSLPAGGTPLYDAVSIMAQRMRDRDPAAGAIIIATDGGEGGSQFTDLAQAKSYLDWCRAKGWPVTFIGADFSNAEQARMLGADDASAIGVAQARLSDATRNLAKKRARHARSGDDIGFTDDEKQQFGGYLAAPK